MKVRTTSRLMTCAALLLGCASDVKLGATAARGAAGAGAQLDAGRAVVGVGGDPLGGDPLEVRALDAATGDLHAADAAVRDAAASDAAVGTAGLQHVIVIAFENHDESSIVGNATDAPYINGTLLPAYASASSFVDALPIAIPSEPHYVLMEAGTATFPDHAFTDDADPSAQNGTGSTEHLSTQLDRAGLSWMAYQEGMDATSGACPIHASGYYKPKHDPFIFFRDVSGDPPSATNARCAAHHAPIEAFFDVIAADGELPAYAFVTPDQCHDMHGQAGCPSSNLVRAGDTWLAHQLPAVIAYAQRHRAVVLLVWDEGEKSSTIPFIAIGPDVKPGYVSDVRLTHGSLIRTVENVFGLPPLATVVDEHDLSDLFEGGTLP